MKKLLLVLLLALVLAPPTYGQQGTGNGGIGGGAVSGGGGGSGDITDVWACTTGNCNAITGALGDTFNATLANSSIPQPVSATLPATCTEGMHYQDTDSGGTETYVCTATDTWTKLGTLEGSGLVSGNLPVWNGSALTDSGIAATKGATNNFKFTGGSTGIPPLLEVTGDTDLGLRLKTKGIRPVTIGELVNTGAYNVYPGLQVLTQVPDSPTTLLLSHAADSAFSSNGGSLLMLISGRGSHASPQAVHDTDTLGVVQFGGKDQGSDWQFPVGLYVHVNGTVSGTSIPADITFFTGDGGSTYFEPLTLTSAGLINLSLLTASRLVATDASKNLASTITATNFLSSVTGATEDALLVGNGTTYQEKVLTTCTGAGKAVTYDASANTFGCNTISAGGTPGGSTTQVQYNNAGAFGGISGATTNGTVLTLVAPVLGVASATSVALTGTAGAGFEEYIAQSSAPSAPSSGFREYADSTGRKSWIRASDGFTRTWDATLTANRVYTLPDANSTLPVFSQVVTFAGPTAARTVTLPDSSFTVAGLGVAQTFSAVQTFSSQTINSLNGAASTPPVSLTGTWFSGGSATTTKPQLLIEPSGTTSTAWSTSGTGIGVNAASGFGGNLIDLKVNNTSAFYVTSGALPVSQFGQFHGGSGASGVYLGLNGTDLVAIGNFVSNSPTLRTAFVGFSSGVYTSSDAIIGRDSAAIVQLGIDAATATAQTLKAHDGSGTDKAGADLTLAGGNPTGAGTGSQVKINTTAAGSTGSTQQTSTTRLTIASDGAATFTDKITSSRTTDLGWSVVSATNQACNTTCTSACVVGTDAVTGGFLACTDATADVCLCAGAS